MCSIKLGNLGNAQLYAVFAIVVHPLGKGDEAVSKLPREYDKGGIIPLKLAENACKPKICLHK